MRKIVNLNTGVVSIEVDAPPAPPEVIANETYRLGKDVARARIAAIRLELTDHLVDLTVGTPAEQGQARAAIGLLRAELAIEKAKL